MELNELPGSELILPGLEDLYHGRNNTIGSLLISIASIRLTAAGLDIPQVYLVPEPELALYNHLQIDRDCLFLLPTFSRLFRTKNNIAEKKLQETVKSESAYW
jgi:hypothetical protein